MSDHDEAIQQVLTILPTCTQCGHPFTDDPCGFGHMTIKVNPLEHVIFEPLTEARDKAAYRAGYQDGQLDKPSAFPLVQPRDKRRRPA